MTLRSTSVISDNNTTQLTFNPVDGRAHHLIMQSILKDIIKQSHVYSIVGVNFSKIITLVNNRKYTLYVYFYSFRIYYFTEQ